MGTYRGTASPFDNPIEPTVYPPEQWCATDLGEFVFVIPKKGRYKVGQCPTGWQWSWHAEGDYRVWGGVCYDREKAETACRDHWAGKKVGKELK